MTTTHRTITATPCVTPTRSRKRRSRTRTYYYHFPRTSSVSLGGDTNNLKPTTRISDDEWTYFVRPVTTVIFVTESAIVSKSQKARPTLPPFYIQPTPKPTLGYWNFSRAKRRTDVFRKSIYIEPTPRPVITSGVIRANLALSPSLPNLISRVTSVASAIPDKPAETPKAETANAIASRSPKDFSPSKVVQALALGLALIIVF